MSDETYFKDLMRKMKELRVSGSGEIIIPSEKNASIKFTDPDRYGNIFYQVCGHCCNYSKHCCSKD